MQWVRPSFDYRMTYSHSALRGFLIRLQNYPWVSNKHLVWNKHIRWENKWKWINAWSGIIKLGEHFYRKNVYMFKICYGKFVFKHTFNVGQSIFPNLISVWYGIRTYWILKSKATYRALYSDWNSIYLPCHC